MIWSRARATYPADLGSADPITRTGYRVPKTIPGTVGDNLSCYPACSVLALSGGWVVEARDALSILASAGRLFLEIRKIVGNRSLSAWFWFSASATKSPPPLACWPFIAPRRTPGGALLIWAGLLRRGKRAGQAPHRASAAKRTRPSHGSSWPDGRQPATRVSGDRRARASGNAAGAGVPRHARMPSTRRRGARCGTRSVGEGAAVRRVPPRAPT